MRLFAILSIVIAVAAFQPAVQAKGMPGSELLTPEERTHFNERFADAPDSATRARIRQEQIKLIQQRRLDARKQKILKQKQADQ